MKFLNILRIALRPGNPAGLSTYGLAAYLRESVSIFTNRNREVYGRRHAIILLLKRTLKIIHF